MDGTILKTAGSRAACSSAASAVAAAVSTALLALAALWLLPRSDAMLFVCSGMFLVAVVLAILGFLRFGWQTCCLTISFLGFFGLAFPVSGIVLYFFPEKAFYMLPSDPDALSQSLLVGGLGWTCFALGAYWHRASWRAQAPAAGGTRIWNHAWLLLLVIAAAGLPFRFFVQTHEFSLKGEEYAALGTIPAILCNTAMFLSCALWKGNRPLYRVACLVLLAAYSGIGLFSGQRAEGFMPWLVFALFMLLAPDRSRRTRKEGVVVIAALAVCLLVGYPLMTRYKTLMGQERVLASGNARIGVALEALADAYTFSGPTVGSDQESLGDSMLEIVIRYSHLQHGANLVTKGLDTWGYLRGRSLGHAVAVFVPRFLWPDKPTIGIGQEAYHLMGFEGTGCATVPIAVDWYLNFGVLGVVVGMAVTGRYYSAVNCWLLSSEPLRRSFLAFLVSHLMIAGLGIAGIVSMVFLHGAVAWFVMRLVCRAAVRRVNRSQPPVGVGRRPVGVQPGGSYAC